MRAVRIRSKSFLILFFYFFTYSGYICAQTNISADLNFNLPEEIRSLTNISYGVHSHPNEEQVVEGLIIKDYVLVYEFDNQIHDFFYEESDSLIDIIVSSPDTLGRAVINIGFWGIEPSSVKEDFLFNSYLFNKNASIVTYFSDLINSDFENITSSAIEDLKLVVVRFKSKENKSNDNLLYSSMQERIKLQSRYLFLLWDTSRKENLPDLLKNAEIITYPIKRDNLLNYLYKNPLIFENKGNELNNNSNNEFAHINFEGNFKDSLIINYEVYNILGDKVKNESVYACDGISIYEKLPPYDLPFNEFINVIIVEPYRYNITLPDELPEDNWKTTSFELQIRRSGDFDLRLQKIPDFELFYLDIGSFSNRRTVLKEIYNKIKILTENGDNFYLFVSNATMPLIALNEDEYYNVLSKAGTFMPDPPDVNDDVSYILENIDWKGIMEVKRDIKVHYYLSESTYKLNNRSLISGMLSSVKNMSWEVYITVDSKKIKKMADSPNNYHYTPFQDK